MVRLRLGQAQEQNLFCKERTNFSSKGMESGSPSRIPLQSLSSHFSIKAIAQKASHFHFYSLSRRKPSSSRRPK